MEESAFRQFIASSARVPEKPPASMSFQALMAFYIPYDIYFAWILTTP